MKRTVNWYLDKALEKQGFKSDRQLSIALCDQPSVVNKYRKMIAAPSPQNMIKLAEFAEVPKEVALADLGYWTNFDTAAAPVYEEMASIVAKAKGYAAAAAILAFTSLAGLPGVSSNSAKATTLPHDTTQPIRSIYIMGNLYTKR